MWTVCKAWGRAEGLRVSVIVHSPVEYLWDGERKEWFVNVERLGH